MGGCGQLVNLGGQLLALGVAGGDGGFGNGLLDGLRRLLDGRRGHFPGGLRCGLLGGLHGRGNRLGQFKLLRDGCQALLDLLLLLPGLGRLLLDGCGGLLLVLDDRFEFLAGLFELLELIAQFIGGEAFRLSRSHLFDLFGGLFERFQHVRLFGEGFGPVLLEEAGGGLVGGRFGLLQRLLHLGGSLQRPAQFRDIASDLRLLLDEPLGHRLGKDTLPGGFADVFLLGNRFADMLGGFATTDVRQSLGAFDPHEQGLEPLDNGLLAGGGVGELGRTKMFFSGDQLLIDVAGLQAVQSFGGFGAEGPRPLAHFRQGFLEPIIHCPHVPLVFESREV